MTTAMTAAGGDMTEHSNAIGMAWYSPKAWRDLCALPGSAVEKTYVEFVHAFERAARELEAQGLCVVKMPVDVAQMAQWCARHGMAPSAAARAKFGAALMIALDEGRDVMSVPVKDARQ